MKLVIEIEIPETENNSEELGQIPLEFQIETVLNQIRTQNIDFELKTVILENGEEITF